MKKIKTIFLSTLLLILILGTKSFALTEPNTMTGSDIDNILDYFYGIQGEILPYSVSNTTLTSAERKDIIKTIREKHSSNLIARIWNDGIETCTDIEYMEQIVLELKVYSNYMTLYVLPCNNTLGDSLPFLTIKETYSGDSSKILYKSWVTSAGKSISYNKQSYIKLNNDGTIDTSWGQYRGASVMELIDEHISVNETLDRCKIVNLLSLNQYSTIYLKIGATTNYYWFLNTNKLNTKNRNVTGVDTGEEDGTTSSGESTGSIDNVNNSIDVSEINNSLNIINEKIPTSGDIESATQAGVINASKEFWGDSENLTGENEENEISNEINNILNEFNESLENNSIFKLVELAELGFIEILQGKPGDFKITWDSVKYNDVEIVPSGELNFTQIVKDIPELDQVKTVLNIILSAFYRK